jgi:hypothetical protein
MNKYSRYCCSNVASPIVSTPYCKSPIVHPKNPAVPESVRVRMTLCTPYIRPGTSSLPCSSTADPGSTVSTVATTFAPVTVRTPAASETALLRATEVVNVSRLETNPDTRFAQFFPKQPPPPLSKICPERIPNNYPVPPDRPCVGYGRFQGSTPI